MRLHGIDFLFRKEESRHGDVIEPGLLARSQVPAMLEVSIKADNYVWLFRNDTTLNWGAKTARTVLRELILWGEMQFNVQ